MMKFCIACQIGSHELCEHAPECSCDCQVEGEGASIEFSPEQLKIIETSEAETIEE